MVKTFFRIQITQYWHFQGVTTKEYWPILISYQKVFILSQSYYQTVVNPYMRVWMDTLTDRKFLNRTFPGKSEKSQHTHMKQKSLSATVLEFTWLVIANFMKENGPAYPIPKRKLGPPDTEGSQEIWIFYIRSFTVPPEKNHPKSVLHKPTEKWLNIIQFEWDVQ